MEQQSQDLGINRSRAERRALARREANAAKRARKAMAVMTGTALASTGLGLATAPSAGAEPLTFTVTSTDDIGEGTLRDAIDAADANEGADTIDFDLPDASTITLASQLFVEDSVTIDGPGRDALTISGAGATRIFYVLGDDGMDVTIAGLTLTEGLGDGSGGAVFAQNTNLELDDLAVTDSSADWGGGIGVFNFDQSTVEISSSEISGNAATASGGGLYLDVASTVTLTDVEVLDNTSFYSGGGLYASSDSLQVSIAGSTFSGNEAQEGAGGAVTLYGAALSVTGSTFSANVAYYAGGAIHFDGGQVGSTTISSSTIDDNTALYGSGGGLYFRGGELSIADTSITANDAPEGTGGGVFAELPDSVSDLSVGPAGIGDFTLTSSTVDGNTAEDGAGVSVKYAANAVIEDSTISGNIADSGLGGGLFFFGTSDAQVVSSTISGNSAYVGGAIMSIFGDDVSLLHSTVASNSAHVGAVLMDGPTLTLDHSIIADTSETVDLYASDVVASWSLIETPGDEASFAEDGEGNVIGVDPLLGALAENGGPTQTHLPGDGSPAIDAGNPDLEEVPDADQRGFLPRLVGDAIDIGSIEVGAEDPAPEEPSGGGNDDDDEEPAPADPDPVLAEGGTTIAPDRQIDGTDGAPVIVAPSSELAEGETEAVEIAIETDAGTVSVVIEQTGGDVATTVTVTQLDVDDTTVVTSGFTLLGQAFEVDVQGGGDGENEGGTVCFPYDPADVSAAGLTESDLVLFHFLDDGTREALATTVDSANNRVCAHVDSFSPFAIGDLDTTRFAGDTAARTAAAISEATFDPGVPVVHIVTRGFDGLGAGAAAASAGGPVLLVDRDEVPLATRFELERLGAGTVVVVGGAGVISDAVVAELGATRVAGADRYATAAALSAATFPTAEVVYVASGGSAADALVASVAAAAAGAPLLLVEQGAIPASTAAELARLDPARVIVVGGSAAVSDAVLTALGAERLAGADRYATAAAVAQALGRSAVFVARGDNPVDAVAGIPAAAAAGAAMLLVQPDAIPEVVSQTLTGLDPTAITLLGGTAAISMPVEVDLAAFLD